jgi:endonuclease YncB( thermonuclease family)
MTIVLTALLLTTCRVVDGDTIRCGAERIRLLAIDAPEMKGHCRRNRRCAPGDPLASRASLGMAMKLGPIRLRRTGRDRYGRTLAQVWAGSTDLSCWQLQHGQATARPEWDSAMRIARTCPHAMRPSPRA